MNSVANSLVIIPGVVAFLLFLLFTYLHAQSRQAYFRAWQLGWAAYTLHYGTDAWIFLRAPSSSVYFSSAVFFVGSLLLVSLVLCIFVYSLLLRDMFRLVLLVTYIATSGVGLSCMH